MNDYDLVEYTRGTLDLIRDFIKLKYPEEHKKIGDIKTEITSHNILKGRDIGYYVREIKEMPKV